MFKKIFSCLCLMCSFLFVFNLALAEDGPNLDNLDSLGGFSLKSSTQIAYEGKIKSSKDFPAIINASISVILGIFATIILGIIMYAGIKMITSNGKIDSYQEGLKLLKTAIIAMLIILLSYAISSFALKTIGLLSN